MDKRRLGEKGWRKGQRSGMTSFSFLSLAWQVEGKGGGVEGISGG